MKKALFLIIIVLCCLFIQAQESSPEEYKNDTIWLVTELVVPCEIVEDSSSWNYVFVYFINSVGLPDQTIFSWDQIEAAHKGSKEYFPRTSTYRVDLIDGTSFTGILLFQNDSIVEIQLVDIGFITINRPSIKQMIPIDGSLELRKNFWFKNPHATRLLFAPTAIPLKKGEAYYQNIYIVGNMFNYGLVDNLSIGGGFDFITMFTDISGNWSPMLNLNIKTGFKVAENLHVGAGGIVVTIPDAATAGLIYGLGTVGSYNSNFTFGLGWGFVDDTFQNKPFIMFGGMARLSEKLWLVSENWIAPIGNDINYYGVFSYGLRFAANRIAVDLAFINNADIFQAIVIGIPFVDFVIKIGK